MGQRRLKAFTEAGEETFVIRDTPTQTQQSLDEPRVQFEGLATMYGPNNQLLTRDEGEWFREVHGNARFRVPESDK